MARYLQASKSQLMWAEESVAYTKESTITNPFGLIPGDIDFPVANPKTARSGGGSRKPYCYSKDEFDLKFGLAFNILGAPLPLACAVGKGAATSGTGYTGTKFSDGDLLDTITVRRQQTDAKLVEDFVGCKADLTLSAKMGDAVSAKMDFVAASRETDDDASSFTTLSMPCTQELRFWMVGAMTLKNGGTVDATLATINGFNLGWKNGLKAYNHGGGRNAYCVAEEESEGRYDMGIDFNAVDNSLYKIALGDEKLVDIVIPIIREGTSAADMTDGVLITLEDCDILDAPLPHKNKGIVAGTMKVAPKGTSIEIRTPTGT